MKQLGEFVVDGKVVEIPGDERDEFEQLAKEHAATPDELHSLRVTEADGRSVDVKIPESQREEFERMAEEKGATFEPLRTLELDDGTKKSMTGGEISRYLRSPEYRAAGTDGASGGPGPLPKDGETIEQGSVTWAAIKGAIGGFFTGAWAGGNAAANKIVKAIPEIGIEVESAAGNLARFAGKGLKAIGAKGVGAAVEGAGESVVESAEGAKAWLDEKLPSDVKDWLGYEDWSTKVVDWTSNAAAMAVKFAPGMAKMGAEAFMETIFASDGVNAAARAYDTAIANGQSPEEAAALGGEAFLLNYFGGKALTKAGAWAEGIHGPVKQFMASGMASSGTMATQAAGNKMIDNLAEGKPVLEGVAKESGKGFVEGWAFHGYNALPGLITGVAASRAEHRRREEYARGEILRMVETDADAAKLAMWMDGEALDAAIRARKAAKAGTDGGSPLLGHPLRGQPAAGGYGSPEPLPKVVELAREAGLPETMTPAEINKVLDAVAEQREALANRVRIKMDDVQAEALCETVSKVVEAEQSSAVRTVEIDQKELMERTWNRAADKVTDARDMDDPELREKIVKSAAKEVVAEMEKERRAELDEKSRIRGAEVGEQMKILDDRGIATWEDAEAAGLVGKDERGRWSGGARQAVNISVNGTEALKTAVKDGKIGGDLAEEMITLSHCELGWMPKESREAIIDKVLEAADGNAEMAQWMMEIVGRCDRAELADVDARVRKVADEVAQGLAEQSSAIRITEAEVGPAPETAYEGAKYAERLKGTELKSIDGGMLGCERFPEVSVEITQEGIKVEGLTDELMSKPENTADTAALLKRLDDISRRTGLEIDLGDANALTVAQGIIEEVKRGSLKEAQRKMDTRAQLFDLLMKTTLGNGVTYDEASFKTALEKTPNGRRFVDNHGNIYGFKDGDGVLHFNPAVFNYNTPIHEYGHLALESLKGVNPALLKRGMELIKESDYYKEFKERSEKAGDEYSYLKGDEEGICDEALATLIGDRGQRLVDQKGLGAELRAWLKEFWAAIKGAFGIADLTPEQIEKMTLRDFADVMNAELLRGKEFGTKKQRPLSEKSIKRYDEAEGSGSNGMLRWKNDRGRLFYIPVDMEKTQPGGKVVLATDDANVTDWIQQRLNGVELRMSKTGKIYVKGSNGLDGELAEIFGRYPKAGQNDGIFEQLASELQNESLREATPDQLVAALIDDRANYDAWLKATADGKTLEALKEEQHWAEEAEREAFEARERFEQSGMGVLDYIRSRAAEEGEPGFDLDWETMRELAREQEEGKFAFGGEGKFAAGKVNVNLKSDVEAVLAKRSESVTQKKRHEDIVFSDNVPIFPFLGLSGAKVVSDASRVRKMVKKHHLTADQIAELPNRYGMPVALMKDGPGFVALTDMIATSDHGDNKPVCVALNPKVLRSGEVVFLATAMAHDANKEFDYYQSRIRGGLLYADIDKAAGLGLEEETESILRTQAASNGDVKTPAEFTAWSTAESIPNSGAGAQGAKLAAGRGLDGSETIIDASRFVARRARVAADAGVGEQTPGAIAASRELATQGTTPISQLGQFRKMSLPLSELLVLQQKLTGSAMPGRITRGGARDSGQWGSHTKAGQIAIQADLLGMVDGTDMVREKETLKQHGFYQNEDSQWLANHSQAEIRAEQRRSEDQLATQLLNLAKRRTQGTAMGGGSAARRVFADQVAKYVMDMPQNLGGTLGRVQTVGRGVRADVRARFGGDATAAKSEAGDFLDWAYGAMPTDAQGNPVRRAEAMSLDDLTSSMFGAWLVTPQEVERRAPKWDEAFTAAIAADARLLEAFKELSVRAFTEQSHTHVELKIEKQLSRQVEEAIKKLEVERTEKISTGSKLADAKETVLVGLHDKFAPVYVRVDEKLKAYRAAKKQLLKRTASAVDRAAIRAEIDRFEGEMAAKMHKLELSRTAFERGAWNEGRRYWMEMARLDNDATGRWGLEQKDISLYLELQRVIETQGRSGSFGQSPQQARLSLGDMARRLGAAKWARMEEYSRRFHDIIMREIYDDPRVERALGKGIVDYFRSQSHYVTTKRTFSPEELDAIETARAQARAAGVAGGDDVITEMYKYAGSCGAGDVAGIGAAGWTAALKGSFAAKQEVRSATWMKHDGLMQFARRNQMILDLRDALVTGGVEGVRELPAAESAKFPDNKRYGHLTFMENGQKRVLVVPKQIAEAFKADPDLARWITKANGWVRKALIDYNVAYWAQNIKRNQDSIEKNMPGTRETYLKTLLRATGPGASPIMDLTLQALVRRVPKTAVLFNDHTVFAFIPKAERYARILEDLSGWQKELWAAEDAHDAAKVTRMYDDYAGVMEMLKGNFLTPTSAAYAGGDTTHGFVFDAMNRKGMKTLAQIEEESQGDKKWSKFVRKVNVFRMNAAQQEHEEILAKTIAYLHDRAHYSMERSVAESGLMVKKNVSIAEGERKGRLARPVQQAMAQFYNMVEKGVTRHWRNYKERPGEMLVKDGKVWIGRAMGMMLANGAARAWMLADSDGDEEKARQKYGLVYDYAAAYHTAWKNCSNYVKENYNFTPIWNSKDGFTSVIFGGALTDEDKLIVPTADFVANMAAHKMGVGPKPEIGKTLANATFKAVTPDLALASPVMNFLRSTVEAALIDNPTDYFRGAPMYDQSLWEVRNESWEMRGKFAAAVGAKLWGDLGGRAIWAPDIYGVDNGRGNAPETVEAALRKIPVMSPAFARMVKIQVGSPAKHGEAITEEAKRRRAIIDVCAKDLMRQVDANGVDVWERDPQGYERQLATWKERYKLNDLDVMRLRVKYLNGAHQRKNRAGFDQKELGKLMKEAARMGMTKEQFWLELGEM